MSILDIDNLIQDNTEIIHEWLKNSLTKGQYNWLMLNDSIKIKDNIIDIDNNINIDPLRWKGNLPPYIKFGKVTGNFVYCCGEMTSLEGTPDYVGGSFDCSYNLLQTLENGPKYVGGSYYVQSNKLTKILPSHNLPKRLEKLVINFNIYLDDVSGLEDIDMETLYMTDCESLVDVKPVCHIQNILSKRPDLIKKEMDKMGIEVHISGYSIERVNKVKK